MLTAHYVGGSSRGGPVEADQLLPAAGGSPRPGGGHHRGGGDGGRGPGLADRADVMGRSIMIFYYFFYFFYFL